MPALQARKAIARKEIFPSSSPREVFLRPIAAGIQHKKCRRLDILCPSDDSCAGSRTFVFEFRTSFFCMNAF